MLSRKQKRMRAIVLRFQEYVRTYSDQAHYDQYRDDTFLDDMIYGIGSTLKTRYSTAAVNARSTRS